MEFFYASLQGQSPKPSGFSHLDSGLLHRFAVRNDNYFIKFCKCKSSGAFLRYTAPNRRVERLVVVKDYFRRKKSNRRSLQKIPDAEKQTFEYPYLFD